MTVILKGSDVAKAICKGVADTIASLNGYIPHLSIVRIGDNPADIAYENGARKRLITLGIEVSSSVFDADITQDDFIHSFSTINKDQNVDAILLLRPFPQQLDESSIQAVMNPGKDIDCFTPINIAKVFLGDNSGYAPCTAEAVIRMLKYVKVPLSGKRVAIVGRSMVVGKPAAMMLLHENATVTICHTKSLDLSTICRESDIIVAAAGKANLISADHVSYGSIVIDVGINFDSDGKLCGDVVFNTVYEKTSIITPVPGGVGSVTTSILAEHVVRAAMQNNLYR